MSRASRAAIMMALLLLLAACRTGGEQSSPPPQPGAIRIGSFDFSESKILAEIYATALDASGFPVARRLGFGPREIIAPALEQDQLDFIPEYLGTSLTFVTLGEVEPSADPTGTHGALRRAYAERGVEVLDYAPAQDQNGVAVTVETAGDLDLEAISDLRPLAADMTFGGPPECPERPFCLLGLERTYGLEFGNFLPLDAGGPFTIEALDTGQIDAALLFTTDPNLGVEGFTLLDDDQDLQPAENIVPVVRREVIERHGPRLVSLIRSVTKRITTETLRALNGQVSIEGQSPGSAASEWLRDEGLL